ncbi:hypothetical protein L7F22_040029 [Adiantum nelumboides]|nr:hypothetical protein [Adiantum nelumboides]
MLLAYLFVSTPPFVGIVPEIFFAFISVDFVVDLSKLAQPRRVGIEPDDDLLGHFFKQLEGKDVNEVLALGRERFAAGGGGGGGGIAVTVAGGTGGGGGAAPAAEEVKEEKKEEKEESDEVSAIRNFSVPLPAVTFCCKV